MFFMVRSAVCIGIVYCMLPDGGGTASLRDLAADAGRSAAGRIDTYCAAQAGCVLAGARVVSAVLAQTAGAGTPVERRPALPAPLPVRNVSLKSATAKVQPHG